MAYRFGQILIIKDMVDPNGVNPKNRRAVVVTNDADLDDGKPLVVVAIAGLRPNQPLSNDAVPLPWQHHPGHPITKLVKRSAAFCSWIQRIDDQARVLNEDCGRVVGPYLTAIIAKLAQLKAQGAVVPGSPPKSPEAR